jgi:hypothetical protein
MDLAHNGPVAMRDDEFARPLHQRQQGLAGLRGKVILLLGGSANPVGMRRVSADRNKKALG